MEKQAFPRPDWSPVPRDGCANVDGQVFLVDSRAVVATLKLKSNGHTDLHPAKYDIHVLCTDGAGFTQCGDEHVSLKEGESVLWPKHVPHKLYTEDSDMTTIMIEHVHQLD